MMCEIVSSFSSWMESLRLSRNSLSIFMKCEKWGECTLQALETIGGGGSMYLLSVFIDNYYVLRDWWDYGNCSCLPQRIQHTYLYSTRQQPYTYMYLSWCLAVCKFLQNPSNKVNSTGLPVSSAVSLAQHSTFQCIHPSAEKNPSHFEFTMAHSIVHVCTYTANMLHLCIWSDVRNFGRFV